MSALCQKRTSRLPAVWGDSAELSANSPISFSELEIARGADWPLPSPSPRGPHSLGAALAQRHSFPFASAWSPHKEVLKGNAPLACGKRGVALQAANFALL
jgi:hypothetical protein